MPPLDFPSSPVNGQTYGDYFWDASTNAWRAQGSTNNVGDQIAGLQAKFPVSVANGGTGATTVAGAQDNLGVGLVKIIPTSATYGGGSGSTTDGVVSFTTCTSITINGVFNSAFDNYRIVFSGHGSAADNIIIRGASGGTPDNTSTWNWGVVQMTSAAVSFAGGGTSTSPVIGLTSTVTNSSFFSVDLYSPAMASSYKKYVAHATRVSYGYWCYGYTAYSSTYDGLYITPASGNMSGKITIFGFNQ